MPLHVRVDINDEVIAQLTITRQATEGDRAHYYYDYRGVQGSVTGYVWHRPVEGAMVLVSKAIERIDFPNWKLV